jgi:hypothetical protein
VPMFEIWSLEGDVGLGFSDVGWDECFFSLTASLIVDGERSSADVSMIAPHAKRMLDYFEGVAQSVNGWPGAKVWTSEHNELTLACEDMNREQVCGIATLRLEPTQGERIAPFIWWRGDVERIAANLGSRMREPSRIARWDDSSAWEIRHQAGASGATAS